MVIEGRKNVRKSPKSAQTSIIGYIRIWRISSFQASQYSKSFPHHPGKQKYHKEAILFIYALVHCAIFPLFHLHHFPWKYHFHV